ncbi:SAM-dependent methyltransferase [Thermococcus onnurineus NA1]|uniref:SAM-dependent methyltransferase n=1 Tax=Thermococcus onnurineus (strain NA1) TaxID=523850 RepID=B6YW50_THEON|nr:MULTISPECIES: methyltransferase domain-containing protein [Thermococcus]ACJ17416.1 SAM-dependent methyltransferase [Thermococcus onnurineus NA1]NJE45846.1 methyltransferase domain-containing protein [Thermococcus sp. GR7]NJE79192.1 methyltransferase domain-containing protein [Thermococcus sp. GR4]NJF22040.1 methyltransferase domain-containing protein [Thermococcus sp. GR5]
MSLEELYRYLRWRMDPDDELAVGRFWGIMKVFEFMEGLLPEEPRVLDLCAGTGIAGAAAARATNAPLLTVLDARKEDLEKARKWIEIAGISPELRLVTGDVREVSKLVGEHDLALLWGLTMPHFDPFDVIRIFANVALSLNEDGVFVMEETDRVYGILYQVGYKDFLVESKTEDYTLISVHEGYNLKRGTFKRTYYKLPGFEKITEEEHRLWDLASQLAIGSIFFREWKLITRNEHGINGVSHLLYFRRPKKNTAREVLADF